MRLLLMKYEGMIHTAYCDSFNTARVLHKLFCTESLDLDFEYINPRINRIEKLKYKNDDEKYNCPFANFLSSELLARFSWNEEPEEEETSSLVNLIDVIEIKEFCSKYKIKL